MLFVTHFLFALINVVVNDTVLFPSFEVNTLLSTNAPHTASVLG